MWAEVPVRIANLMLFPTNAKRIRMGMACLTVPRTRMVAARLTVPRADQGLKPRATRDRNRIPDRITETREVQNDTVILFRFAFA